MQITGKFATNWEEQIHQDAQILNNGKQRLKQLQAQAFRLIKLDSGRYPTTPKGQRNESARIVNRVLDGRYANVYDDLNDDDPNKICGLCWGHSCPSDSRCDHSGNKPNKSTNSSLNNSKEVNQSSGKTRAATAPQPPSSSANKHSGTVAMAKLRMVSSAPALSLTEQLQQQQQGQQQQQQQQHHHDVMKLGALTHRIPPPLPPPPTRSGSMTARPKTRRTRATTMPSQVIEAYYNGGSLPQIALERLVERQSKLESIDLNNRPNNFNMNDMNNANILQNNNNNHLNNSMKTPRPSSSWTSTTKSSRRQWIETYKDVIPVPTNSGVFVPSSKNPALEQQRLYLTTVQGPNGIVHRPALVATNKLNSLQTSRKNIPELEPLLEQEYPIIQGYLLR